MTKLSKRFRLPASAFVAARRRVLRLRLVEANEPGRTNIKYHNDDTVAKKLAIMEKADKPQSIFRYIIGTYQIRDGKQTWFLGGGQGQAEIIESDGLEVDLTLLNELNDYVIRARMMRPHPPTVSRGISKRYPQPPKKRPPPNSWIWTATAISTSTMAT